MGRPLLLYGLAEVSDYSFEDDAAGIEPSAWDVSASIAGINLVDADEYQNPGDGLASLKSLQQNVDDATAGNVAVCRQRFALTDLLNVLREEDEELAACASVKFANQTAHDNSELVLKQYDATGTSTPGSGVLLTAPSDREFLSGGPDWFMRTRAVKVHADTAWVDLELRYDISLDGYDATADVWWDRVFLGGLVDFDRGLRKIDLQVDPGVESNVGWGVFEQVRVRKPNTQIDIEIRNIFDSDEIFDSMGAFTRLLSTGIGLIAIWGDRDKLTNRGRHFQQCFHDRNIRITYSEGRVRRDFRLRLQAPSEGA